MLKRNEKIDYDKIIVDKETVKVIEDAASGIFNKFNYDDKIIGENIFEILEKDSIVLYYPMIDEESNGMYIDRYINGQRKHFVYINTSKPYYDQIFTAAHELGHILGIFEIVGEKKQINEDSEENIIDRFAAEILMPKNEFTKQWNIFSNGIKKDNRIKVIDFLQAVTKQMILFKVSFASTMLRLAELKIYNKEFLNKLFLIVDTNLVYESVQRFLVEYNSNIDIPTSKKYITGLYDTINEKKEYCGIDNLNILEIIKYFELNINTINGDINKEILSEKFECKY